MKKFVPIQESGCHPDDNRVFVPVGWTPILYNEDEDDTDYVDPASLPEVNQVVMAFFDDRVNIQDYVLRKQYAKLKISEYSPTRTELVQYNGLDSQNIPQFTRLLRRTHIGYGKSVVFESCADLVIAWHPIIFPTLEHINEKA